MKVELFNVFWWDRDGFAHRELSRVDAEAAVRAAHRLAEGPASVLGFVERVIITDSGDLCCFEWKKGHGRTFPKPKKELLQ